MSPPSAPSCSICDYIHLSPEPVEGLIKTEHPPPLPDVCRPSLSGRGDPPPLLALLRVLQLGPGGNGATTGSQTLGEYSAFVKCFLILIHSGQLSVRG